MRNMSWSDKEVDTSFAIKVMDELSQITDNNACGGRSAGSPAEHAAADYLMEKFREAGLVNVTKDPCNVDKWVFEEAKLTYTDSSGAIHEVILGGYACNADCSDAEFIMVYGGRGAEADLKAMDVNGKLVLIDINQAEDWWINFPTYEAGLRGAAGVICVNVGGFGQVGDNVLVSEDICGPADRMVFSMGKTDGQRLRELMEDSDDGEITVVLNARSHVSEGGISYNIWGDIPGKTDEVIYVINHYDSYYFTVFDDVQGIGWALGLAKMFTDSGYIPEKTIRFVAHGAEEWGLIDSKYDWAVGAYKQITEVRPEWKETGFAVVNLDGFYAVMGEKKFCIVCTKELYDFAREAVSAFGDTDGYEIEVNMKLTSSTEDFSYTKAGMPSMVAGAYDGCLADRKVLHSSACGWDAGFDIKALELFHRLFAHIIVSLDEKKICPVNMTRRIEDARDGLEKHLLEGEKESFSETISALRKLDRAIDNVNSGGDIPENCRKAADFQVHELYRYIHGKFIKLNWNDEMIAPHERYLTNIIALEEAKEAIEKSDPQKAAAALSQVDFNYYAVFFSENTYTYFEEQVTRWSKPSWGTGLVENGNENLYGTVRALLNGKCGEDEMTAVSEAAERQRMYLKEAIEAELSAVKEIGVRAEELTGTLYQLGR